MTLHDLLDLCMDLNECKGIDTFFEYAGHVDWVSIRVNHDMNYTGNGRQDGILLLDKYVHVDNQDEIDKACNEIQGIIYEYEQKVSA